MKKKAQKKVIKNVFSNYDIVLTILVVFLCAFGLIMVYSASSYRANYYYQDSTLYFRNQGYFILGGIALMVLISMFDYRIWFKQYKYLPIPMVVIVFFIGAVLCWYVKFAGHSVGGSSRWIKLGPVSLQPSELAKVGFVLFGTFLVAKLKKRLNTGKLLKNLFLGFVPMVIPFVLVLVPVIKLNLSSAVVLAAIIGTIFLCVSREMGYFWVVLAIAVTFGLVAAFTVGYRAERIEHWLNPETMDQGDQIMQGLYAIGSGGLFGKGLGNSVQKLGNMPEVHTDMIFTIICEELGIIGGIALIMLFMLLAWRVFKIALNAPDLCGSLIAAGVFAQIAVQVIMNVAVVTNSMPATGVPLPFVSYGGSSLLVLMAEMGIVLSVSNHTYRSYEEDEDAEDEELFEE